MQVSLFFDYSAFFESCPFYKKYNARFWVFDMIYNQSDYPALLYQGAALQTIRKIPIESGYDERKLCKFIVEQLKAEPFIPLNKRNKQPDKTLGSQGRRSARSNWK